MPLRSTLLFVLTTAVLAACGTSRPALDDVPPVAAGMQLPGDFAYPADDTVTVVTWNVEHFVDAFDNPYIDNDREDAPDAAAVRAREALLGRALRALDADVVVLEEFESAAYLEALAETYFPELGYRFFSGTESPDWYQNVVVMSRLPLGVVRAYRNVWMPVEGEQDDAGRPAAQSLTNNRLWAAEVLARPDYTFTLVAAHLKAGRGARNEGWRRGQIRFVHADLARLRALRPEANVLVAGDLNLTVESGEHALLLNRDGALGPVRFVDPLPDAAHTHPSDDPARRLDYLLPSETMQPELVRVQVARPLPAEQLARMSDHLPVRAVFVARD